MNIKIVDKQPHSIRVLGKDFHFLPWINSENYEQFMQYIEECSGAMIAHLEVEGFSMFKGMTSQSGLDPDIFKNYDIVFSGHYHTRSKKKNIQYVGAPYEMCWSDADDPRGFAVFDTETNDYFFVDNPNRIFHKIKYSKDLFDKDFSYLKNCYVKLLKHTITSTATNKISAPPLSYAWAWDPFTLPSTTLDNPQHLDHMIQELRERIYNIQSNATDPKIFEQMIVESTFSVNYTSVMIWLSLAMASLIYLVLFIIAFIMYIKHRKALAATSQNQNVRNPTNTYINPTHTYAPIPQSHEPQNQVACIQRPPNPPPPPPPQHQIYPNHHYTHVPQPSQNQLLLQELSQALINHSTNPRNTLIRLNPS